MPFVKPANLIIDTAISTGLDMTQSLPGGIDIPVRLSVLAVPYENPPQNAKPGIPHFKIDHPSLETAAAYMHTQRLMAMCGQNAEEINRLFKLLNYSIFSEGLTSEHKAEVHSAIERLDFMTLKNVVVTYLRDNVQYKDLVGKQFRKELDDFIVCRNIFIHGKLLLIMPPGNTCCVAHIDNHTKKDAYMPIDDNVIKDYIALYGRIKEFARGLGVQIII